MGCEDQWRENRLHYSQVSGWSTWMSYSAKHWEGKVEENVWEYAAF